MNKIEKQFDTVYTLSTTGCASLTFNDASVVKWATRVIYRQHVLVIITLFLWLYIFLIFFLKKNWDIASNCLLSPGRF